MSRDLRVCFSHNSDEWETPKKIFEDLDKEFNFNVDLAASNSNHLCRKFFTAENSALNAKIYNKNVFCNPPYSKCKEFVELCNYLRDICGCLCVMLLPVRTDTKWFHNFIYHNPKTEIRFIQGRLHFSNSSGGAPFPSMIVIFKHKEEKMNG